MSWNISIAYEHFYLPYFNVSDRASFLTSIFLTKRCEMVRKALWNGSLVVPLRWRHNGCDCVSNHRRLPCLLYRVFFQAKKERSKLRPTVLCEVTGEFPAQRASNAENISIWRRHHEIWKTFLGGYWNLNNALLCPLASNLKYMHSSCYSVVSQTAEYFLQKRRRLFKH